MNLNEPVEIAEGIFWVGAVIPQDQFQCHVYLIRNGDESILIDPGSRITYDITKKKIEQLVKLKDIKYLICHHQDPDIIGCIDQLIKDTGKAERYIITHWRAWALLKHCDWDAKLYEVEENGWKLKAGDRLLKFIFTPYMHFPGAICTYDTETKVLFSSDIFGGFTPEFELFAKNSEDYFEKLKPFHEHYMPSNSILRNGLSNIEKFDIELIAPQHGSIIKKEFIKPIIEKMKKLECGLFGKFTNTRDVIKLSKLNDVLEEIIQIIAYQERFYKIIDKFLDNLRQFYNIDSIKAFVMDIEETGILELSSKKTAIASLKDENKLKQMIEASSYIKNGAIFFKPSQLHTIFGIEDPSYTFPIKDKDGRFYGVCFIIFNPDDFNVYKDLEILSKFEIPISMAILTERKEYCTKK
ncbi:MBL fold metallo-hydrolase [Hippea maritima]|uniref:Beta-lactamase domain protein n=1 Tax=Hippea maritima (strain ATCC 700847 / DSM 10411 / MH2) TaxID=760142 RepID=F2LXZ7_HIPMA|nr:MBL fold metallo-hydrolase [Hippea maritima]AEA33262.1 beta-lactamase domain protein [Hippea maritima DSM 10411]